MAKVSQNISSDSLFYIIKRREWLLAILKNKSLEQMSQLFGKTRTTRVQGEISKGNPFSYLGNHTVAEVIFNRAGAEKEVMGLMTFPGNRPYLKDVVVAKSI